MVFRSDMGGHWRTAVTALVENRNQNCLEPREGMPGGTEDGSPRGGGAAGGTRDPEIMLPQPIQNRRERLYFEASKKIILHYYISYLSLCNKLLQNVMA